MKKTSLLVMLMLSGAAQANHQWAGLYMGLEGGLSFNDAQLKSQQLGFTNLNDTCNVNSNYPSLFSGLQLGYLFQLRNAYVAGVETNVTFNTNQNADLNCNSNIDAFVYDGFTLNNQMQVSVKGRIGRDLTWHNQTLLPYLTAGASFANTSLIYQNEGGDYFINNPTQIGWLIGAGIEWGFKQHWSLRAEYYYVDYGNIHLNLPSVYDLQDPNGHARVNLSSNNVALAVNYWI